MYRDRCVVDGDQAAAAIDNANRATNREVDWKAVMETALNSPGELGNTYNRFHRYSFMNNVLLLMQGARGPVASYQRWQDLGRQVTKGSRGYEIVRPIQVKPRLQAEPAKGEDPEKPKTFTRFKVVRGAFTYSQTSGEELPEPEMPAWDYKRALGRLSIEEEEFEHIDGNIQGYVEEMTIAINPVAPYPVKTRMHEMAHVVLGHTMNNMPDPDGPLEYDDRGFREFEAEGTAYLTLTELGLTEFFDPAESRAYIQGWMQGREATDSSIRKIFKATNQILVAGYPEVAE